MHVVLSLIGKDGLILLILGIVGLVLSVDRMITMTIESDGFKQYYAFLVASHPGQWLSAATLFFGGIGDLLLSSYLKLYNRTSERTVFYAQRGKSPEGE